MVGVAAEGSGVSHRVAQAVGRRGEDLACAHLVARGFELVERNWRCSLGELDIVARRGDLLVFCEVKTRRSQRFGSPLEAVTHAKALRLRKLAARWTGEHSVRAAQLRIDVIAVLLQPGTEPVLQHVEGIE